MIRERYSTLATDFFLLGHGWHDGKWKRDGTMAVLPGKSDSQELKEDNGWRIALLP